MIGPTNRSGVDVLIVGPLPQPKGGVSIHIERLMRALERRGIRHAILDESRIAKPGVANFRSMSPWRYVALMSRARLIHVHSGNVFVRFAHTLLGRLLGKRVVQTHHSFYGGWLNATLVRLSCRLSHRNIFVNSSLMRRFDATGDVLPAFIPPAPADETIPDDLAQWIGRQQAAERNVICLNGFRVERTNGVDLYGFDLLIDALAHPLLKDKYAGLMIVSSLQWGRDYYEQLQARISALRLDDRLMMINRPVNFAGVIRRADIFVRPTTTDGDAVSIREGLWYGKPVVASDAVARPEGTILFRSRDVEDFAAKIAGAATRTVSPVPQQDFADGVIAIYDEVLGRRGAVPVTA